MGIQIFVYLDDWLVVAQSEAELKEDTRKALEITTSLGWIVNYDKSSLSAAQKVTYLGAVIDFQRGLAFPTPGRIEAVISGLRYIRSTLPRTARALLVLLGYLASLVDLVPWCRLYMRPLQLHLLSFRPSSSDLLLQIPPAPHLESIFQWWCSESNLLLGVSPPPHVLHSDYGRVTKGMGAMPSTLPWHIYGRRNLREPTSMS